jgi:hypothetical protein
MSSQCINSTSQSGVFTQSGPDISNGIAIVVPAAENPECCNFERNASEAREDPTPLQGALFCFSVTELLKNSKNPPKGLNQAPDFSDESGDRE